MLKVKGNLVVYIIYACEKGDSFDLPYFVIAKLGTYWNHFVYCTGEKIYYCVFSRYSDRVDTFSLSFLLHRPSYLAAAG